MIKFIKDSWLVVTAALVFGLLVAGVNGALRDRIDANKVVKRDNSMKRLLGDDCKFEPVVYEKAANASEQDKEYFKAVKPDGELAGYCFLASGGGFADRIDLLIAVDSTFSHTKGYAVMYSQETPGFGDKIIPVGPGSFSDEFVDNICPAPGSKLKVVKTGNKTDRSDKEVVAITGATISSEAVTRIVNNSVLKMKNIIIK